MSAAVQAPVLREVRLYGELGRSFGRVHRLAVLTPAEAVQALCAVLPGFERAFVGPQGRAEYHLFVGRGPSIALAETLDPVGAAERIRIVPAVSGAKNGLFTALLGAALIFVAPFAAGAIFGAGAGLGFSIGAGVFVGQLGTALVLGGIVQLLSPQRKASSNTAADNLPSYGFDAGAVNTTQQGLPVPLCFGRMVIGSATVSEGLAAEEYVPGATLAGALTPATLPAEQPLDPIYGLGQYLP